MKKIALIIICLFTFTLIFADSIYTPSQIEKANKISQKLKISLDLTPIQTDQVEVLYLEVIKKLDETKAFSDDKDLLKTKIQQINTYRTNELIQILSDQQYNIFISSPDSRTCQ